MADAVTAQITDIIITQLGTITGYGTLTIEQERVENYINGRYPYVQLCGPKTMYPTEFNRITSSRLLYLLKFYTDLHEGPATDPLPRQLKNLHRDIMVALKLDQTFGGLAQSIDIEETDYDAEIIDNKLEFFHYVEFFIDTVVDDEDFTVFE